MTNKANIYLIGPMASGKTAIGKQLAQTLKRDFYDSDLEIINQTGVSIEHIFDVEGEKGFRNREQKIIKKLTRLKNIVLATGGGAVLTKKNRKRLSRNGMVIYLSAPIDILAERIKCTHRHNRPLLNQGQDVRKTLQNILTVREPLYQSCADLVISTEDCNINTVIEKISNHCLPTINKII